MEVFAEACINIHNDTDLASKTAYAQKIGVWCGGQLFLQNLMQKILVSFTANRKAIMAKDIVSVSVTPPPEKKEMFQMFRKEYTQLIHIVNLTFLRVFETITSESVINLDTFTLAFLKNMVCSLFW